MTTTSAGPNLDGSARPNRPALIASPVRREISGPSSWASASGCSVASRFGAAPSNSSAES
jgi:hypothetical protein